VVPVARPAVVVDGSRQAIQPVIAVAESLPLARTVLPRHRGDVPVVADVPREVGERRLVPQLLAELASLDPRQPVPDVVRVGQGLDPTMEFPRL